MGSGSKETKGELRINVDQSIESEREGLHACMGKVDGSKRENGTFRGRERAEILDVKRRDSDLQY